MKFRTLLIIFISSLTFANAQGYEGTIEFNKLKKGKVSSYIYYVKGDFVRLEEYGTNKTIVDIALINLKEKKVYLLSPERKSYMILNTMYSSKDMSKTRVEMKNESKTIMGRSCKKWVVSNPDLNATVTYWVTKGNFDFFVQLLDVLRRKDYQSLFFQQVPEAQGYFPMVSTWTDMNGVQIEQLEVTKIDERVLRGNFFTIPEDYEEIKN
ncbi:MAG TPA: hypothetical protein DCX54_10675 [Flavobacteriales bacterium]|nr:hypothetical protein [Flavobacteriales bacterium]